MEKLSFNIDTKRGKLTQSGVLFAGGVREVDFLDEAGENLILFLFHRREDLLVPVALTEKGEDGKILLNMNGVGVRESFDYVQAAHPGSAIPLEAYVADGDKLEFKTSDKGVISIHELGGRVVAHGTVVLTWAPFNFEEDGRMVTMKGEQGGQGIQGERGTSIEKFEYVSEDERGFLYRVKFDDGKSADIVIPKGDKGDTGNGILSITKLPDDFQGNHYYRITMTDGSTFDFTSTKGDKGDRGTDVLSVEFVRNLENGDKVYKINLSDRPSHEIVVPKGDKGKEIVDFTFVSEESRFWNYFVNFTDGSNTLIQIPKGEKVELIVEAKLSSGEVATGAVVTIHYGSAEGPIAGEKTIDQYGVMFELTRGQEWTAVVSDKFGYLTPDPIQGRADYSDKIELKYRDYAEANSLADVQQVVNACEGVEGGMEIAKEALIGVSFDDTWTDVDVTDTGDATPSRDADGHPIYDDPLICTDIRNVTDEKGESHLGAVLFRKYKSKYAIPTDAPNDELATEEFAEEGVVYFGYLYIYQEKTYAVGDVVWYNDKIYRCVTKVSSPEPFTESKWQEITAQEATWTYLKAYQRITISVGDPIPYDRYGRIYHSSLTTNWLSIIYGYNNYKYSVIRQYLNSSSNKGEFWKQMRLGQKRPTDVEISGYLKGCSMKLLSAIKAVNHTCYVVENGTGKYIEVCDKVFVPSATELFLSHFAKTEGTSQIEYWRKVAGDDGIVVGDPVIAKYRQYRAVNRKNHYDVYQSIKTRSLLQAENDYYLQGINNVGVAANQTADMNKQFIPAFVVF